MAARDTADIKNKKKAVSQYFWRGTAFCSIENSSEFPIEQKALWAGAHFLLNNRALPQAALCCPEKRLS